MKNLFALVFSVTFLASMAQKQPGYWQQEISYQMNVDVNVKDYTYTGTSKVVYTNNSPETLDRVFFHLYFNAFQPGSDMDHRLQSIADPDSRMVEFTNRLFGQHCIDNHPTRWWDQKSKRTARCHGTSRQAI